MNILFNLLSKINDIRYYKIMNFNIGSIILTIIIISLIISLRFLTKKVIKNFINKLTPTRQDMGKKLIKKLHFLFDLVILTVIVWISVYILGIVELYRFIDNIARISLIFIVTIAIYRTLNIFISIFQDIADRSGKKLDSYFAVFLIKTGEFIVLIVGIVIVIKELGYDVTTLITGLGVGGLAIALAGKDFVANIFGFLTIFMDKSFSVGDWISTPDVEGIVEDIGMRSTKVRTFNHALVTIPNSILAGKQITNWSKTEKRRISFKLNLDKNTDTSKIEEVSSRIQEELLNYQEIHSDSVNVYFADLTAKSHDIMIQFSIKSIDGKECNKVQHEINIKILEILQKTDVNLPLTTECK